MKKRSTSIKAAKGKKPKKHNDATSKLCQKSDLMEKKILLAIASLKDRMGVSMAKLTEVVQRLNPKFNKSTIAKKVTTTKRKLQKKGVLAQKSKGKIVLSKKLKKKITKSAHTKKKSPSPSPSLQSTASKKRKIMVKKKWKPSENEALFSSVVVKTKKHKKVAPKKKLDRNKLVAKKTVSTKKKYDNKKVSKHKRTKDIKKRVLKKKTAKSGGNLAKRDGCYKKHLNLVTLAKSAAKSTSKSKKLHIAKLKKTKKISLNKKKAKVVTSLRKSKRLVGCGKKVNHVKSSNVKGGKKNSPYIQKPLALTLTKKKAHSKDVKESIKSLGVNKKKKDPCTKKGAPKVLGVVKKAMKKTKSAHGHKKKQHKSHVASPLEDDCPPPPPSPPTPEC